MMSNIQHAPEAGAGYNETEITRPGTPVAPSTKRRAARWSARRRREAWLLLLILLLGMGTVFVLSGGGATLKQQANGTLPTPTISATGGRTAPTPIAVVHTQAHLYPFSASNVGLMQPAVDAQGHVWV